MDCDEALIFDEVIRWIEHSVERGQDLGACTSLLRLVRFPLMDSCLLSDVIKVHPMMAGTAERVHLILEAFEHHALK